MLPLTIFLSPKIKVALISGNQLLFTMPVISKETLLCPGTPNEFSPRARNSPSGLAYRNSSTEPAFLMLATRGAPGVIAMSLARQPGSHVDNEAQISLLSNPPRREYSLPLHRIASLVLLSDIVLMLLSGAIPVLSYSPISSISAPQYLSAISIGTLLFVFVSWISHDYEAEQILNWRQTFRKAIVSLLITFFILILMGIATKVTEAYSRVWFYAWIALSLGSLVLTRVALLIYAEARLSKGAYLQRALVVAGADNGLSGAQLSLEADNRIRIVGTVCVPDVNATPDLEPYIRQLRPEIIVLNLPWSQIENAIGGLKSLSHYALEVLVLPQSSICMQKAIRLRRIGHQNLLQIMEPPIASWDQDKKRALDVTIAALALLITSPLLLLVALAIKFESKGPVLFRQMRVGFNGDMIEVWKFRSMRVEDTDPHAIRQTSRDDPRVTRIGRFIRRTSIDELPQFWNVLQGQMSVVGPRPHALRTSAEGEALETIVTEYMSRHRVKPGITGWAQVNGARGELRSRDQVKRRVAYDLYYIEHWSVYLDIKIILITIMKVLYDSKAY